MMRRQFFLIFSVKEKLTDARSSVRKYSLAILFFFSTILLQLLPLLRLHRQRFPLLQQALQQVPRPDRHP